MSSMVRTIRAFYDGEVLRPEEPLDLEPNERYLLTVEGLGVDAVPSDRPLLRLAQLARPLDLPPDFAKNLHHYLHGHPKEEE